MNTSIANSPTITSIFHIEHEAKFKQFTQYIQKLQCKEAIAVLTQIVRHCSCLCSEGEYAAFKLACKQQLQEVIDNLPSYTSRMTNFNLESFWYSFGICFDAIDAQREKLFCWSHNLKTIEQWRMYCEEYKQLGEYNMAISGINKAITMATKEVHHCDPLVVDLYKQKLSYVRLVAAKSFEVSSLVVLIKEKEEMYKKHVTDVELVHKNVRKAMMRLNSNNTNNNL